MAKIPPLLANQWQLAQLRAPDNLCGSHDKKDGFLPGAILYCVPSDPKTYIGFLAVPLDKCWDPQARPRMLPTDHLEFDCAKWTFSSEKEGESSKDSDSELEMHLSDDPFFWSKRMMRKMARKS